MLVNIFEKIDELKAKDTLSLSEINDICNEFDDDRRCIDVFNAIIQFSSLIPVEQTDLNNFVLPNTKETWIEVASALATEHYLSQPMDHVIETVALGLEISVDDIISFLKRRNYIMSCDNQLLATALGIEKGYVINTNKGLRLTDKCVEKIRKAFLIDKPSQAERERIDRACREAERRMKPFSCGKAE
ncbi:MAG: hypothetical protein K6E97_03865 [Treponema sp.]|nr:hypothetical protein [Treponema sp.]